MVSRNEIVQNGFPPLDYIINANNFQKIQGCLSEASDMAMLTVDYQGMPVTQHSHCSKYCAMVRASDCLSDLCRKCDSRGGLEAARLGKPYLYICHMGLIEFAVPIVVSGHYTGAVLAGQVILKDESEKEGLEKIADSQSIELDPEFQNKLEMLRSTLPVMTKDRVQVIANMMFQITNYIIEEALAKINLNEAWEASFDQVPDSSGSEMIPSDISSPRPKYNSLIIKPSLEYIQNNYEKGISLDEMASLCNISSSYFSKLFHKVTGDTFANYINQVRVEKACELLSGTDTPITMIALDLGFEDSSYFNKVFKRITGVTPSMYKVTRMWK